MKSVKKHTGFTKTWLTALIGTLVGLTLLFVHGLWRNYQHDLEQARADGLNLARTLQANAGAVFQRADAMLAHVADEVPAMLGNRDELGRYLVRFKNNLPEVLQLRVIGVDGYAIMDSGGASTRFYAGDFPYFQQHRDNPAVGLYISNPLMGSDIPVQQIVLSRRINNPDGGFAGIVSAAIAVSHFDTLVRSVDIGKKGSITLLGQNLNVVTRYPQLDVNEPQSLKGGALSAQLAVSPVEGTYVDKSAADGMERLYAYARVGNLPFTLQVGLARDEVLAAWWSLTLQFSLVVIGLMVAVSVAIQRWLTTHLLELKGRTALREITANLGEGVYMLDRRGLVTFVNPQAERLLGWTAAEMIGRNGHNLFHYKCPDGSLIAYEECPIHQAVRKGQAYRRGDDWLIRKDGSVLPVSVISSPLYRDGKLTGSITAFQDVSLRQEEEAVIQRLASNDPLTGLANRQLLLERLDQALAHARHHPHPLALLALDLDRFSEINGALGVALGDDLLKEVAGRLTAALRPVDTAARTGGDDFLILLPEIGTAREIAQMVEKILNALRRPVLLGGQELQVTASLGIATLKSGEAEAGLELVKQADIALQAAKRAGRNTYRFFHPPIEPVENPQQRAGRAVVA